MPTFCVYSHTPLQVSCQYATGHRIRELLFSWLGNVCIGRICLLAYAVFPCVLFCTISSCDDTPKDTELTLLGGNKSRLSGNWAERCNPSVSQPFKQQFQWVSMTINLDTLGWLPFVQGTRAEPLYKYIKQQTTSEIREPQMSHLLVFRFFSPYSSNSKWALGSWEAFERLEFI